MPDFTVEFHQVCSQTIKSEKVESSKGGKFYDVTASLDERSDSCSCPGFQFHRRCRHVDQLRQQICGWDEGHSTEVQTPQQEMEGICPKCGAETTVVRTAV